MVWILLLSVVVLGVLLLFVLPGRTMLAQRHTLAVTQGRVIALSRENAKLDERVKQLQDPAQIQQIARTQYGLIMPGQQAYAIIPSRQGSASFWSRIGF
ncbi:MAG: septum formation initiator family protein [Actinomycetota bacterium]|nr:septum formation initiator family protein [Actinomycetota bacterium]